MFGLGGSYSWWGVGCLESDGIPNGGVNLRSEV